MRRLSLLTAALLVIASCGDAGGEPGTTGESGTTTTVSTMSTTTSMPTTTTAAPSTTSEVVEPDEARWSVTSHGRNPDRALGPTAALGSGCAPGRGDLPDGVWFGWVDRTGDEALDFDLACIWPGRIEPAASNDSARVRTVPISDTALVYLADDPITYSSWSGIAGGADNAPGLPNTLPYWLFVNDGEITEMAEFPDAVIWARSDTAWPQELVPGCCDLGDQAPASPLDPYPGQGWPADGFYKAWAEGSPESWIDTETGESYQLSIFRWLSCGDNLDLCPEWWTQDNVIEDPASRLERTLVFDEGLTVVVMPIFTETAIVGDGVAFRDLLRDMQDSLDEHWPLPELDELQALASDPAYPFGVPESDLSDGGWPVSYRGPGGTYLFWGGGWWALEIRNGLPVLYIHAGLVAG